MKTQTEQGAENGIQEPWMEPWSYEGSNDAKFQSAPTSGFPGDVWERVAGEGWKRTPSGVTQIPYRGIRKNYCMNPFIFFF